MLKHSGQIKKGQHCSPNTEFKKGFIPWNKGKPFDAIRGKNNPRWKGGKKINSQGYILISKPKHPFADKQGYVREHRLIVEKKLGRYLKPQERVHHKNEIITDNRIENLKLFKNNGEHLKKTNTKTFRNKTHKQCSHCFVIKPRNKFSPSGRQKNSDPNNSWCKKCCAKSQYKKTHQS